MLDVVDHEAFELLFVPDDGSVEEFSADRADPTFGEGVRYGRADGGLEDLGKVNQAIIRRGLKYDKIKGYTLDSLRLARTDGGPDATLSVGGDNTHNRPTVKP